MEWKQLCVEILLIDQVDWGMALSPSWEEILLISFMVQTECSPDLHGVSLSPTLPEPNQRY